MLGLIDSELARFFEVTERTLHNWKIRHPEFFHAIKKGRAMADGEVAASLYHRAIGYSHPEDKIMQYQGEPVVVKTTRHYPPEPVAAIFWLKNRRPDKWSDKPQAQHDGGESTSFVDALKGAAAKIWKDAQEAEEEAQEEEDNDEQ